MSDLIEKITKKSIDEKMYNESDKAIYQYGYQALLDMFLNIVASLIVSCVFRDFVTVLSFLAFYIPLRVFAGGFHAKTSVGCMIMSAVVLMLACGVIKFIEQINIGYVIVMLHMICLLFLMFTVPVESTGRPLDAMEIKGIRKKARLIVVLEYVIAMALLWFGYERVYVVLFMVHLIMSVSLLAQKIVIYKKRVTVGESKIK